ncbi:MAG: hypothetical protein LBG10_10315 [Treponema sp.]|jgi:hypothetical protein|nr:hypothetical protein [Treponema sp.]
MKPLFIVSGMLMGMVFFSACAGEPPKIVIQPENQEKPYNQREPEQYEIINHQDGTAGTDVPEWVRLFLNHETGAVETLEAFKNRYVFIGTNRGNNFKVLTRWAEGFTAAQDFPRLAAVRIEQRLTRAASLYPDDEYGEFFETLVKSASDAAYTGAVKEAVFWVLRRLYEEPFPGREQYDFFVLVTIEKELFQAQVRALMADIKTVVPPARDQAAAINHLRETFFEDF